MAVSSEVAVATRQKPRIGRACLVCTHPKRFEIEQAMLSEPSTTLSRRFSVSDDSILNHRRNHLPDAIVESHGASWERHREAWWAKLRSLIDTAIQNVADGKDSAEVSSALNSASKLMQQEGKGLRILDDSVNVFSLVGFKNEEEALQFKEERETARSLSPAEIHAKFMEFERRYALEAPHVSKDYETLMGLATRRIE